MNTDNVTRNTVSVEEVHFDCHDAQQEALFLFQEQPAPGVLFIHGHKSSAWGSLLYGKLLQRAGFAVCLPSQRGYGFSQGAPDFCGPLTVDGVKKAVDIFRHDPRVGGKIAIWGISRGAAVAAQVITQMNGFSAAVLQAGFYDLQRDYELPKANGLEGIHRNMEREIGTDLQNGLRERSAIHFAKQISCPVLLLHGSEDKNIEVEQAYRMDSALTAACIPHELKIIAGGEHTLSPEVRREQVFPFLKKYLMS